MELVFWLSLLLALLASLAVWHLLHCDQDTLPFFGGGLLLFLIVQMTLFWGPRWGQTHDTELWTGSATDVSYKEGWTEVRLVTTTDSKGNVSTHIETTDHPPEWYLRDSNNESLSISQDQYLTLARRWGHNPRTGGWGGSVYSYPWDGNHQTREIVSTTHSYENRLRANRNNVFRKRPLTPEERSSTGLYERVWIKENYYSPAVYGDIADLDHRIGSINARLGKAKQIRIHVLIFVNTGIETAHLQDRYWEGGKKNELNICLGLQADKIVWCYPFSWTEREDLKADLRDRLEGMSIADSPAIAKNIEELVTTEWERKQFSDFDYLPIDVPLWSIGLVYVLALLTPILSYALCVYSTGHSHRF